jgi:hypothetical protein
MGSNAVYSSDSAREADEGDVRASVQRKIDCTVSVGQSGKHSLQVQHSCEAISGMKATSRLTPLSMNPMMLFFTSPQHSTLHIDRKELQNEGSFSKRALSAPYSLAQSCNSPASGACASNSSQSFLWILSTLSDLVLTIKSCSTG